MTHIIADRYQILEQIGEGGMGTVFRGFDQRSGITVAIKVLKPDVVKNDPDIVTRFEREGEALRKLNHPSIVKMLDSVCEDDGTHYIVMEYVDAGSLQDKLTEGMLSIPAVLNIALDLSDALARAHRLNIIHRDLKPANVLIAGDGTPRLTDFGIARIGDTTSNTRTGAILGTLAYLPPEALRGERIDHRGDIWAFGVMLYEMLTGIHPFMGDNTGAILNAILNLPTGDIRAVRSDTPWELVGLIEWMLEKDHDKRPSSVRMVGAVLENLLEGKEIPASMLGQNGDFRTPTREQAVQALKAYTRSTLKMGDLATPLPQTTVQAPAQSDTKIATSTASRHLLIIGAVLILLLIFIGVGLLMNRNSPQSPPLTPITIAPVTSDQLMVLVAQPERISGEPRDVQRFIVEDLQSNLVENIPFEKFAIRAYPAVITSQQQAIEVAREFDAAFMIWGNYDVERVEMNVIFGDVDSFPQLVFSEEAIRPMTDVRYSMRSERSESLAIGIVAIHNMVKSMDNDIYSVGEGLYIIESFASPMATVVGNTVAVKMHQSIANYTSNPELALQLDNEAIVLDSNNPMLYAKRSLTNLRLNQIENSIEDLNTARTFGPDTWAVPDAMLMNITVYSEFDLAVGLEYASRVAELAPQDWFSNGMVATLSYLNQDFEKAQRYVDITLPLNPRSNFLYSVAISLALREGDFLRAQSLLLEVLEKFPDPRFTERVIRVAFSPDATQSVLIPYASAFGNFTLRRWQEVIRDTEEVLASGFLNSDLYFLQGFSYCNLDLLAEAEAAYTQGIESDSQAYLLYFMRAEVRRAQGNLLGALSDIASVNNSPLGAQLAPLILASTNPETDVSCKTFIDLDLQALGFTAEVTDTDTD